MLSKKIMLLMVLSPIVVSSRLMADTTGTIGFSGTLVEGSCEVDTATSDNAVEFGTHLIPGTVSQGTVIGTEKSFTINLTNCPTGIPVSIAFDATTVPGLDNLIQLDPDTSVATGVGIEILDPDGASVPLNKQAGKSQQLDTGGDALTFNYTAQIVAAGSEVSAGAFNATSSYSISYP